MYVDEELAQYRNQILQLRENMFRILNIITDYPELKEWFIEESEGEEVLPYYIELSDKFLYEIDNYDGK